MEYPSELRLKTEELAAKYGTKALAASAQGISERYREKVRNGKSLLSGEIDTIAYAAVRMPATFGAVSKALSLCGGALEEINSVLDVGAGTGAASHAAQLLTGCGQLCCIEREQSMISLGQKLMSARGISAEWLPLDIAQEEILRRADLVISSYCLNELSDAALEKTLSKLWNAADKLLLITESGTPSAFALMKKIRAYLISKGGVIAAPCPHSDECPLPVDDWCHFTARVSRTKLHRLLKGGDAPYEDEKFCFLAISKQPAAVQPCAARILRHPIIESGKITLRLCESGGIADRVITRKSPLFKAARKADSGDSFS